MGIENWDWGLGLGIRIEDWEWEIGIWDLGLRIRNCNWGSRFKIGIQLSVSVCHSQIKFQGFGF